MSLLGIGSIVEGVGKVADDLFTSDEERSKLNIEAQKIEVSALKAQMGVNQAEAQHKSIFVAGWRPFIGWVGGLALAYQFLLYPVLIWSWAIFQSKGWIPVDIKVPPVIDSSALFAIVTGMLGIGGMRSFDKMKKTQTDRL